MQVITIPSLSKYQHYRDRPHMPWIKWHKACLRDYKFGKLTNSERWIFIGLVLLAVENDNRIPADFSDIARKISYSSRGFTKIVLKLLNLKLIAIKRIAKGYQNDDPDKIRADKIRVDKNGASKYKFIKKEGSIKNMTNNKGRTEIAEEVAKRERSGL